MFTIEEIKNIVFKLGNQIGLETDSGLYPMFSKTPDVFNDGVSIYVDNSMYHYVNMSQGNMRKHIESNNLDDIMYEVFKSATSVLAQKYELEHRDEESDFRRIMWKKQLTLLKEINPNFVERRKKEIDDILAISPYRD
ncbi:Imm63 family immunity protein [Breznakia pachnodae]|uniref:Immunity protein 63 domain-containing protein n=1 Tax=Breznakia pachnodae TaxID=265178 RepID=A0ABU0E5H7_9FIRM|nr:Imm63 family immunity protein [Breznakia pachnodae]MDQ0362148.1 hypothetical protein [Breznakia pachnodae]